MHILFDIVIPLLGIYSKINVQDVQGQPKISANSVPKCA